MYVFIMLLRIHHLTIVQIKYSRIKKKVVKKNIHSFGHTEGMVQIRFGLVYNYEILSAGNFYFWERLIAFDPGRLKQS